MLECILVFNVLKRVIKIMNKFDKKMFIKIFFFLLFFTLSAGKKENAYLILEKTDAKW